MSEATSLPKIALENVQDFLFIKELLRKKTNEKLELHLPEQASREAGHGEEDVFRKRVKVMINELLNNVYEKMLPNLTINGFEAKDALSDPSVADTIEPFDYSLRAKVQNLYNDLENAHTQIAQYRNRVPDICQKTFANTIKNELEILEKAVSGKQINANEPEQQLHPLETEASNTTGDPFIMTMKQRYLDTLKSVSILSKEIPEVIANLEENLQFPRLMNEEN
ncbi:kinetochore protein Mis14 [Schizosaccharomyces japonicus yFS275]|uniref:Kinetochore protein Mis14 n=1 Tax=Schizosaccharomyces japonicus (strain yFS275 / FY16936) TaxID=402676 RepID=B6K040_SCHJY|nr:kinetochore protein Mis14 [Schizosaccharomyces japonicus yFS275]EEB06190.2 kinetochore protein Mis14 [Schizosaccharomyces japonicus yFS275]